MYMPCAEALANIRRTVDLSAVGAAVCRELKCMLAIILSPRKAQRASGSISMPAGVRLYR